MKKQFFNLVTIFGFTLLIFGNSCTPASNCSDGIQNGTETGIDCGGNDCPACVVTPTCIDGVQNGIETGIDCGGSCSPCATTPTCTDGIQNGTETGVDCGGSCQPCGTAPTCSDGIMNGNETGIDCGGPDCPACVTCTDGIQNGNETGIDCGGSDCPACPTCSDGIQNGNETGVDCGGSCPPCVTTVFTCDIDGVFWNASNTSGILGTHYDFINETLRGVKTNSIKMYLDMDDTPLSAGTNLDFVSGPVWLISGSDNEVSFSFWNGSLTYHARTNSGNVTITEYNTTQEFISGTFNLTAYNQSNLTDTLVITNGQFTLPW